DRRALVEIQRNVAFQMNREAQVAACRKPHGTTASGGSSLNRSVDGGGIERFSIPFSAECSNVVFGCGSAGAIRVLRNDHERHQQCGNNNTNRVQSHSIHVISCASCLDFEARSFGLVSGNDISQYKTTQGRSYESFFWTCSPVVGV